MAEKIWGVKKFVEKAQKVFDENPLREIDREFTRRESGILKKEMKRKGSDIFSLAWTRGIIRRVHYLYKLLDNENHDRSLKIVKELIELICKTDNPRFVLSKPLKEFSNKSRILLEIFLAGETTTTAGSAIITFLFELLEEKKEFRLCRDKNGNVSLEE